MTIARPHAADQWQCLERGLYNHLINRHEKQDATPVAMTTDTTPSRLFKRSTERETSVSHTDRNFKTPVFTLNKKNPQTLLLFWWQMGFWYQTKTCSQSTQLHLCTHRLQMQHPTSSNGGAMNQISEWGEGGSWGSIHLKVLHSPLSGLF